MVRSLLASLAAVSMAAACSSGQSPVSPDSFAGGDETLALSAPEADRVTLAAAGKGKPGATRAITVTFENALGDYSTGDVPEMYLPITGGIDSPVNNLSATVRGTYPNRVIEASGSAMLKVLDVVPDQGEWARNCDNEENDLLRLKGLVGDTLLSGFMSWFVIDEAQRVVRFRLDGILPPNPGPGEPLWFVAGSSSFSFLADIVYENENTFRIVQNYGEIGIRSDVKKNQQGASCRGFWSVNVELL